MIEKEKIEAVIKSGLSDSEVFIVDIKIMPGNRIQVFADKPSGISIETCAEISRIIDSGFNREEEDFELQVSSPGLDQPFRVPEQYQKNVGKPVKIVCLNGDKYSGVIKTADPMGISLEAEIKIKSPGTKKSTTELKLISLSYSEIKSAKANLVF